MNPELDEKLVKAFPNLYAECWGFECGDGWYDLLWELSSGLEFLIRRYKKEDRDPDWLPRASQVKEKFGTLRFYMTCETKKMSKLIDDAETKSASICEKCGAKGQLTGKSWLKTLCEEHNEENSKDR